MRCVGKLSCAVLPAAAASCGKASKIRNTCPSPLGVAPLVASSLPLCARELSPSKGSLFFAPISLVRTPTLIQSVLTRYYPSRSSNPLPPRRSRRRSHGRTDPRQPATGRYHEIHQSRKPATAAQTCRNLLVYVRASPSVLHGRRMPLDTDRTHVGEYWVVNQILAKGLHNVDDESLSYTTNLMDRLEQVSKMMVILSLVPCARD